MNITYIISQICAILGILTLGTSYLCKGKKKILILALLSTIFYGCHNFLLGALTGVGMNIINIITTVWLYINTKKQKHNSVSFLIISCLLVIIVGIISFQDLFSLVPIIATLLFIYSIWQDNTKTYKLIGIPQSFCWISYNIYLKSVFGLITELILLTFKVIGITKHKNRR